MALDIATGSSDPDRKTAKEGIAAHGEVQIEEMDKLFKKVAFRLIPFLFFCYVLNYIDRVNISFAHLQFKDDLGMSDAAYGFGVGIFYVGYILFEVPSNLLLRKIGARKTIARIMVLWGVTSLCMMFVKTPTHFYLARVALGIAEAGFFPGIVYYLTSWFPDRLRARVMSAFVLGIAVAGITGGPISGWILTFADGWYSLHGWQWLFLLEGLPPVAMGIVAWHFLPDSPSDAKWLTAEERALLEANSGQKMTSAGKSVTSHFGSALRNPKLYLCAFGYFTITWAGSVINFWAPGIIRQAGVQSAWHIGLVSAVPYLLGATVMICASRHSDAKNERVLHFSFLALFSSAGALGLGFFHLDFFPAMICLVMVAIGYLSCTAIFWTIPATFLAGTASAGAIAFISSVGQIGSLTAPIAIGWLTTRTHKVTAGLYLASAVLALGAFCIAYFMRKKGGPARG